MQRVDIDVAVLIGIMRTLSPLYENRVGFNALPDRTGLLTLRVSTSTLPVEEFRSIPSSSAPASI